MYSLDIQWITFVINVTIIYYVFNDIHLRAQQHALVSEGDIFLMNLGCSLMIVSLKMAT